MIGAALVVAATLAVAAGLTVRAARLVLRNWLNGADGMALFSIPALDAARGVLGDWWKAAAGIVAGAALALPVGQCQGAHAARAELKAAQAEAAARAQAANAARVERQAAEREADTARNTAAAKGRSDAIHAGPDGPTSGPECRLNRERLLRDGARAADLPPCR
ncbi:hypothetical protein [Phenylobacterium sp.]|uniref:hypothetical protein n=1 Tax=Phenylobacterium sp. TaxID=1871053 RepID=UPI00301C605E